VNPTVKYTLARIGIFVVVLLALWPVELDLLLKLAIAVLFSAAVSWFALRGMRDEVAHQVEGALEKRKSEKEKLRAALAGEDEPHTPEEIAEAAEAQKRKDDGAQG
jgi:hypothetical protein